MADTLPRAVWEGTFKFFGIDLRCYVLEDGRRIIDADDLGKMYEADIAGVDEGDEVQKQAFLAWLKGGA
jgi:hypothetical protein